MEKNSDKENAPLWLSVKSEGLEDESQKDETIRYRPDSDAESQVSDSSLKAKIARAKNAIAEMIETERDAGLAFLLRPIALGLGCLVYFNNSYGSVYGYDVPWAVLLLASGICFALARAAYAPRFTRALLAFLALILLGMGAAGARVAYKDTMMLAERVKTEIIGRVVNIEYRANKRVRYTLAISKNGLEKFREFEGMVHVSARISAGETAADAKVRIADGLIGYAELFAPSGPAYPGGYSYAFRQWFMGIGGSGFFFGKPKIISGAGASGFWENVNALRLRTAQKIRDVLPEKSAGLATALIVGDRSGIDADIADSLRRSGLAHILAISGLHMALVAGTFMVTLRFGLAFFFPGLIQLYPIRKWAAFGAFLAACAYLIISGANVSAQRACIMVSILLLAICFDRRAISMRNVSLAAFAILLIAPEAVLSPGFQMSFAAVMALVAGYEALGRRARQKGWHESLAQMGAVKRFFLRDFGGLALTSLIAGCATSFYAAYHFHQIAPYGLAANLAAMPIVSGLVMPSAVIAVLAMPFGAHGLPLAIMGYGIETVVSIAQYVQSWSATGATGAIGFISAATLCGVTIGFLILCLMKTRLRFAGFIVIAVSLTFTAFHKNPDILILENGGQIGLLDRGRLILMRPRKDKFSTNIWRRAFAPDSGADANSASDVSGGFVCSDHGCTARIKNVRLAYAETRAFLRDQCRQADIIVLAPDAPSAPDTPNVCAGNHPPPVIIGKAELKRFGTHALTIEDGRIRVKRAYGESVRPWNRHRALR